MKQTGCLLAPYFSGSSPVGSALVNREPSGISQQIHNRFPTQRDRLASGITSDELTKVYGYGVENHRGLAEIFAINGEELSGRAFLICNSIDTKLGKINSPSFQKAKLFVLRVSQIHNDLRHIHHLVSTANNGAKKLSGVERQIALHQFLFAVKLWCGTLREASDVIESAWQHSNLHRKFDAALGDDAKAALREFRNYFSKRNCIKQIRNKFAFHYDADAIAAQLQRLTLDDGYEVLGGERRGNIFYSSAETFRTVALLDVASFGNTC